MANQWGIPLEVEETVLARDQRCVYCGCEFESTGGKKRSWEHIVNDEAITTIGNIALCCIGCNASKGEKLLNQWLESFPAKRRGISEATLSPVILVTLKNDTNAT